MQECDNLCDEWLDYIDLRKTKGKKHPDTKAKRKSSNLNNL